MTKPKHNDWAPEIALNEKWVCVRYLYHPSSVTRDVHEDHHGQPVYFETEHEAAWACMGLNRKRTWWCQRCQLTHSAETHCRRAIP